MSRRKEIEQLEIGNGSASLDRLGRILGYPDHYEFLRDNPGAVEAVINWALEIGTDRDLESIDDDLDDEDSEDNE